jgi:hypothetical protein
MRDDGHVQNRAVYVAIGVNLDGKKEVLGLWTSPNEGAKFWLQVLTEMKNRGVQDVFIACVDGLKGFPEAHRSRVPASASAIVHRTFGSGLPGLCVLEAASSCGGGFAAHLHGRRRPMKHLVSWTSSRLSGTRRIRPSARCGAATGSA